MSWKHFELHDSTKRAEKYNLKSRATAAYNRRMAVKYDGHIPPDVEVADARIWQGRNVILFNSQGHYLTEYRWYPRGNRLRGLLE